MVDALTSENGTGHRIPKQAGRWQTFCYTPMEARAAKTFGPPFGRMELTVDFDANSHKFRVLAVYRTRTTLPLGDHNHAEAAEVLDWVAVNLAINLGVRRIGRSIQIDQRPVSREVLSIRSETDHDRSTDFRISMMKVEW